jgi:hydrogenase-1 operon protein HyaF
MKLDHPPIAGPGSQPPEKDGSSLQYVRMPSSIRTYSMPAVHTGRSRLGRPAATALLTQVAEALERHNVGEPPLRYDVSEWEDPDRDILNQVMGEGEVSIVVGTSVRIQESVLAGLWRVVGTRPDGSTFDTLEVGAIPSPVLEETFARAADRLDLTPPSNESDLMNAPSLLAEIDGRLKEGPSDPPGASPHMINLTLLPVTEADVAFLAERLGQGPTTILSRGYGNCRMASTATRDVWWVHYFNAEDELILNHLEITPIPPGACAAAEDLRDSGQRLRDILEVYG